MKKNKVGKFHIGLRGIDSQADKVREFFNRYQILVVRAETMYCSNSIEYTGISDFFDEIATNEIVPHYTIIDYEFAERAKNVG